ncbi:MAG TPA: secretin and TonB N-terminal domain-containing protein [Methylomirabilota bacterium]|nr:secretin and TonB N-terminal domain-containing protein [Methylomirabilota bacterium]
MARRGVLVLLGCAFTVGLVGAARADELAGSPVLLAQLRAPVVAQAAGAQQRPRLISLDFKDADINNILRILAEFSGLNIVTSDDVKGKVTVKLQNVPWQQALDSVVRAAKLAYVQEGNIIRVDKLENLTKEAEAAFKAEQREVEISQRRKEADLRLAEQERAAALARQEFEVKRQQLEGLLAPLVEEVLKLRYGHVGIKRVQTIDFFTDSITTLEEKGVEDAISGGIKKEEGKPAGMLSPRGSLTVDQRTNSLIVRDIPDNLTKIKEFVDKVDRPAPSVLIEARLVEMSRGDARSLGVIWGGAWTPRPSPNGPIIDLRGAPPGGPISSDNAGAATPTTAANFPASLGTLLAAGAGGPFGLGLGWLASNFALDIQLQALEGQRRARILSSPSLLTVDNQPATVASGTKFPIISLTAVQGTQQASISFQDVTTRLQVTPRVVGDGRIVLTIAVKDEVAVERINTTFLIAPVVATRNTITQADIADGGTVVIAGLRQESFQNDERGVPWLMKVPVLGWLFKNDLTETGRRELVVFLTAKVVASPGQAGVPAPALPVAPGAPAPPGPSGEAPTFTVPKTVSTPAPPAPLATPGPTGQAPVTIPKTVSAAALASTPVAAVRPSAPAAPVGDR